MQDRDLKVLKMRRSGMTYVAIGKELAISSHRASQIFARASRLERTNKFRPDWVGGLPPKLANALIAFGFTSKQEVKDALKSGRITVGRYTNKGTVPGIGPKSIDALKEWVK